MKSKFKLYFFGVGLGLKSIFKLKKLNKRILEMLITPMNYWRTLETPLVLDSLKPKKGERILDIGSPKLLSFFISKKIQAKVIASDVDPYFLNYAKDFSKSLNIDKNYSPQIIDARNISLKDNSIDKVYALSVFEHIPEKGDIKAVKEVRRILKTGGIFTMTIPYDKEFKLMFKESRKFYWSKNYNENKLNKEKKGVFYQRIYNEKEIYNRIIKPSKMKVILKQYAGERYKINNDLFSSFLGPFNFILSKLNHTGPTNDLNKIKEPCMVHLVLKK